jgi:hypothetical protein
MPLPREMSFRMLWGLDKLLEQEDPGRAAKAVA